jgi:hypothetical protein
MSAGEPTFPVLIEAVGSPQIFALFAKGFHTIF